jgi:hypothetical protein
MDLNRLRGGELIAAAGGIVLLISLLFLNWYGVSIDTGFGEISIGGDFGAWDHQGFLGTLANLIILAAGIVAVGLAVLTATSRTVALPVAASALTAAGGISAVVMVLLRMLLQPGDGEFVDLDFGIYVALVGAVAVAVGGWRSMQEEGTTFEDARDQLQRSMGGESRAPGRGSPSATTSAPPPPRSTPPPSAEPAAPPSAPSAAPPPPPAAPPEPTPEPPREETSGGEPPAPAL